VLKQRFDEMMTSYTTWHYETICVLKILTKGGP